MKRTVRVTGNFAANLESIRDFLDAHDAHTAFENLLEHLFETIVPNLERFPLMGRDFLERAPHSEETRARLTELKLRAGKDTQIREYIAGDYLMLYAVTDTTVSMLSIRHHRQLSFDLPGHWT